MAVNLVSVADKTVATINSAMTILNRFPDLEESDFEKSYSKSIDPFALIIEILKETKGFNFIVKLLSGFIYASLPAVEAATKTYLIAKLKDIISCSVNPFIGEELIRNGVIFNLEEIDISETLKYSPFDKNVGQLYYFDTGEIETEEEEETWNPETGEITVEKKTIAPTPESLIKSDDMNALLWYVVNKANKRYVWKTKKYRKGPEFRPDYPHSKTETQPSEEIKRVKYDIPLAELNEAYQGGEITQERYNKLKQKLDEKWEKYKRNYTKLRKEDGIVTLEFHERPQDLKDAYGETYNKLQTPYSNVLHVFIGDVRECEKDEFVVRLNTLEKAQKENDEKIESLRAEKIKKENEIQDINKTLTTLEKNLSSGIIPQEQYDSACKIHEKDKKECIERIQEIDNYLNQNYTFKDRLQFQLSDIKRQLETNTRQYFPPLIGSSDVRNYYYGKTLMEFNIDYITSMKFFDEKVLAARLIDALTGIFTIDLEFSYKRQLIKDEITKMVNMIVNTDDVVVSDCFFTFSNEDYDEMSRKAELRKAGLFTTNGDETSAVKLNADEILSKLNEMNSTANKEKMQTIFEGVITELSKEISDPKYKMKQEVNRGVEFHMVENLLNSLAYVLVSSVLSPKMYILLLINLKIIGRETNFNLEGFIGQYKQLIADLIRSIRDQLLTFLESEIMKIISDMAKEIALMLSNEQLRYWSALMKQLIDCFRLFRLSRGGDQDFNVANVDYADILPTEEEPKNNEC